MKLDEWNNSCRINEAIDAFDLKAIYCIMCEHFGIEERRVYLDSAPSAANLGIRSVIVWQDGRFYSWTSSGGFDPPGSANMLDTDEMLVRY